MDISPTEVVRVLTALKGIYTFKELEEYLGISSQVLWRYTRYINIPEKNTAKRIIENIIKNNLIEDSFKRIIQFSRYGYIETWRINRNIHILNLFGYLIYKYIKNKKVKINLIIPLSIDAIPISTIVADWLNTSISILYREPYLTIDKVISKKYLKDGEDKILEVYLPKESFRRNDNILFIDLIVKDVDLINSLAELIKDYEANPWGVTLIMALDEKLIEEIDDSLIKNVYVVIKKIPKSKGRRYRILL